MMFIGALLIGFLIESALAWPAALFRVVGHPVSWIGALIRGLELRLNKSTRPAARLRLLGGVCVGIVLVAVLLPAAALSMLLPGGWIGVALGGVLAWPFLAPRSLYAHVAAVVRPLAKGDIAQARHEVSMIIGRNPNTLDAAAIARASLESLAENTSDGVVAPVFWGVVLGLPGLVAYKAINTLDSMIGHRSARYVHFGMVAARLDDVANLIPARLTGALFAVVSGVPARCFRVMLKDARHHRSPNAGWPESAMAAAVSVRLSGPRVYGDNVADEPWLNGQAPDADADAVARGLVLYLRAMVVFACALAVLALV